MVGPSLTSGIQGIFTPYSPSINYVILAVLFTIHFLETQSMKFVFSADK